jgi:hypothetical protein
MRAIAAMIFGDSIRHTAEIACWISVAN